MNSTSEFRIALVIPRSGSPGLYGPSCRSCAELAADELNAGGGIRGAHVSLVMVDGAQRPHIVAETVKALLDPGAINAIVGMHHSDIRRALSEVIDDRAPYVYAANYEGDTDGDRTLSVGLTAAQQVRGSVGWLAEHRKIRDWYFIGNDYVWPRGVLAQLEAALSERGLRLCGAEFVPMGEGNYASHLNAIQQISPDAVCAALVGADAVAFSRQFVRRGLERSIGRFLPLFEENSLLAVGASVGSGAFTAGWFFADSETDEYKSFQLKHDQRFGPQAPQLNSLAVACYDAVMLLAVIGAGPGAGAEAQSCEKIVFRSALGEGWLSRGHAVRDIRLAEAVGSRFETRARFRQVLADGTFDEY